MKKLLFLFLFISPGVLLAQNIGIGTNSPVYKLQVHNPDATSSYMSITNTTTGATLSDGLLIGMNGSSALVANIENGDLRFATSNLTRMLIEAGGNIGIGTVIPSAKLHVNGGIKIDALNILEFGAGVAGKETNAGKIGYNAFGTTALTFVGAGTSVPNRAIYFFAEGGTTMNGPLSIAGPFRINGNAGTTGQVLTSNGSGDPAWTNASYGNTNRFAVRFEEHLTALNGYCRINGTRYNLNPSAVVVNANDITINQSGLYHFDILVSAIGSFSSFPSSPPAFYLGFYNGLSSPFELCNYKVMTQGTGINYSINENYSIEIYVAAPAQISMFHNMSSGGGATPNLNLSGHIIGHLINE